MSASPESLEFARTLAAEREFELPADFDKQSQQDVSDTITILLQDVEQADATDEQIAAVQERLEVLGPRRDGSAWDIPTKRGNLAVFARNVEKWIRAKEYNERLAAKREALGVSASTPAEASASADHDDIPF